MVAFGQFLDLTKVTFLYLLVYFLPGSLSFAWFICSNLFCSMFAIDGLVRRFLRDENGVKFDRPSPSYDQKDFVPIEVKAGSLVVIHGDLIHQRFAKTILSG